MEPGRSPCCEYEEPAEVHAGVQGRGGAPGGGQRWEHRAGRQGAGRVRLDAGELGARRACSGSGWTVDFGAGRDPRASKGAGPGDPGAGHIGKSRGLLLGADEEQRVIAAYSSIAEEKADPESRGVAEMCRVLEV